MHQGPAGLSSFVVPGFKDRQDVTVLSSPPDWCVTGEGGPTSILPSVGIVKP